MTYTSKQNGFSLVEVMIAMVAGLIVIGSVTVFTISTARSNSQTVGATRLMQDLRSEMNLITREIRRSGYDSTATTFVSTGVPPVNFDSAVVRSPSCIVVRYDRIGVGTGGTAAAGEYHGFRRTTVDGTATGVGVVQASLLSAGDPNCDTDDGWVNVTNPKVADITGLTFTLNNPPDGVLTPVGGCVTSKGFSITVQDVYIEIAGRLVTDATTKRTSRESVRVRNDIIATGVCP
jgi:prepilin peptidase dependent protein B